MKKKRKRKKKEKIVRKREENACIAWVGIIYIISILE